MRKLITIFGSVLVITSHHIKAQQSINFGDFPKPVPSVSSLATYSNAPISNATGLPDISMPLLGLPTHNKAVSLDLSLSYNPLNIAALEPASEVGIGWSLFSGGVISRSIVNELDEKFDDPSSGNYIKNNFNDIYYYNLPGISGKFKVERNIVNNTFEVINLSSNRIKIEYTKENNAATLIFNSFTITDTRGIQYIFNDYSKSNQQQDALGISNRIYKSAFFLTRIKDANNIELANFTYQKEIKYKPNGTTLLYQTCKLKTITSPDFGKIEINYTYDPNFEKTLNDPYSISSIALKTPYNTLISGYSFEFSTFPFSFFNGTASETVSKRTLTKLNKLNKNNSTSETTEFRYRNDTPNSNIPYTGYNGTFLCPDPDVTNNPHRAALGSLQKVISPGGGVTEYNFEPNESYVDKSTQDYLAPILNGEDFTDPEVQYPEVFKEINFNTNQTNSYTFTISGTPGKTRKVYALYLLEEKFPPPIYWDNTPTYVAFDIANPEPNYGGGYCNAPGYSEDYYMKSYNLLPGTHTIQFSGSGGKGNILLYELKHKPQPFRNANYINSLRIGSIKYYKSISETVPTKVTNFDYNSFTNSNSSGGYSFSPEIENYEDAQLYVLYKNVKISNGDDNNGYTKYAYKTPDEYPSEPYFTVGGSAGSYYPYFGLVKGGILEKKEVYNAQNSLIAKEQFDYTFEAIPGAHDYQLFGISSSAYTKAAWLKKTNVISTSYFDNNQSTEEQSESNFNIFNFEMASTKKFADGSITEQFFTYPETGYTQLSNAHIMSIPVMIEQKNDGKTVSKAETKYDNAGSTLPTSIIAFNISDNSTKTAKKIDQYDTKGNVLQFTSETGISTAIVYGYNQTLPIARIEGATYAQVSSMVQTIIDASNADAENPTNEAALLTALENFRKNTALQNVYITTYTYDPLIGVTTTTSPNGSREIYKYNDNNQLEKIVDMNGVTLKEYKYNYKH